MLDSNFGTAAKLRHALEYAQKGIMLRMVLGKLTAPYRDREFHRSCQMLHTIAERFVAEALERQKNLPIDTPSLEKALGPRCTLLDELANDTQDPTELRDHVVHMLMAAGDTTSNLLSFTFFVLARRPDVWEKTRHDVLEHYCDPLTLDAVMKMTYLRDVLRECKCL